MNLSRLQKFYYLKFIRIKGDPRSIAWGACIGAFIGTLPIIPFHTVAIIAVCMLSRNSSVAGLITSLAISNPFTYIPVYYICLKIGNLITPYHISWEKIDTVLKLLISGIDFGESIKVLSHLGSEMIIVMLAGGTVLAIPISVVCYFFTLNFFIKIREKRRKKHILRNKTNKS